MTAITRVGSSVSQSRVTDLLKVRVQENDPTLKASATAFGFKVSGTGSNNGTIASYLKLGFDQKEVTLQVSRGDTGSTLLRKLKAKLPKGYEARILAAEGKDLTIGIAKKAGGGGSTTKVDVAKIPTSKVVGGAGINAEATFYVNKMPGMPHPNAIGSVKLSGTGLADARPNMKLASIDVYEKGTNKKVATIANPKVQETENVRGMRTQTYRVTVPRTQLDEKKQYTFVLNATVNGEKATVRSEYAKLGQVF